MKKLRFKNRGGILYFGFGDKLKSSKLKDTRINRNIILGRFKNGLLDEELNTRDVSIPSVKDALTEVMREKALTVKHVTNRTYGNIIKIHITPYFKNKLISEIKPIDIKKFQDHLIAKGLKKSIVNHSRSLLSDAFEYGIINENITINPIKMVSPPKWKGILLKEKQKPFTLEFQYM